MLYGKTVLGEADDDNAMDPGTWSMHVNLWLVRESDILRCYADECSSESAWQGDRWGVPENSPINFGGGNFCEVLGLDGKVIGFWSWLPQDHMEAARVAFEGCANACVVCDGYLVALDASAESLEMVRSRYLSGTDDALFQSCGYDWGYVGTDALAIHVTICWYKWIDRNARILGLECEGGPIFSRPTPLLGQDIC